MTDNQTNWRAMCSELHYWVIELAASHPNLSESGIAKLNEITDRTSAALRAAADQIDHPTSAHTLYAFADELEA